MNNYCIKFAFQFAHYKCKGYSVIESFVMAANDFKKQITAIIISKRIEGGKRSYIFNDNTKCTYDMEGDYFKFKP